VLAAVIGILAPGGVVVAERATRDAFSWPAGLTGIRDKAYGETRLWYGQAS